MSDLWQLISRVRDAGGEADVFTTGEKRQLSNIVLCYKRTRKISSIDIEWLEQMDANLAGMAEMRRRGRGK